MNECDSSRIGQGRHRAVCPRCSYDLRGALNAPPVICPECGRRISLQESLLSEESIRRETHKLETRVVIQCTMFIISVLMLALLTKIYNRFTIAAATVTCFGWIGGLWRFRTTCRYSDGPMRAMIWSHVWLCAALTVLSATGIVAAYSFDYLTPLGRVAVLGSIIILGIFRIPRRIVRCLRGDRDTISYGTDISALLREEAVWRASRARTPDVTRDDDEE